MQDAEVLADGAGGDAEAGGEFGGGGGFVEEGEQAGLRGAEQEFEGLGGGRGCGNGAMVAWPRVG